MVSPALATLCLLLSQAESASPQGPGHLQGAREELTPESRAWIPLELHLSAYTFLRAELNGVATEVVLDSGAGMSVIDARLARRLGLEPSRTGSEHEGGVPGAPFVEGLELTLGTTRIPLRRALVLDLGGLHTPVGRDIPVMLGSELFERFVVDLDYPRARVALRAPASFSYRGSGRSVPLHTGPTGEHRFEVYVEAQVEDLPSALFRLDTASRELALAETFSRTHALLAERSPVSAMPSRAPGPDSIARLATLRSFSIAGHRFRDVPATFGPAGVSDGALAGSLGTELLARFRVIIDVSRGQLHLEAGPDCETRPFQRNRLGLTATLRGEALEVTFVAPGSPAEAQGWTRGEQIVALDGKPIPSAGWSVSLQRCLEAPAGTTVALTDGEGRVRMLVAADYY